jgi:hypothetical protein
VARFFFGNAVWGCLRLRDIPDRGPWHPARIAYWDETYLDGISRLALIGQKVRSAAELDDALTASRRAPGIRMLWIHESLLDEVQRRWADEQEAAAVPRRAHAPAVTAAAAAAAALLVVGLLSMGRTPQTPTPLPLPNRQAARVTAAVPGGIARRIVGSAVASYAPAAAPLRPAHRPRSGAAYAVSVGTFASFITAERMKHLVMRKGYVVVVVPHGAVSQVMTPPYRTRAQAERVMRGLEGSGLPAHLAAL